MMGFMHQPQVNITSNQTAYDVAAQLPANDKQGLRMYRVTIASGVRVNGNSSNALNLSNFPSKSHITINNKGDILGDGGDAGSVVTNNCNAADWSVGIVGGVGRTSILNASNSSLGIVNSEGYIFGGGGAGGGSGVCGAVLDRAVKGGAGGGGAGGGDGIAGSQLTCIDASCTNATSGNGSVARTGSGGSGAAGCGAAPAIDPVNYGHGGNGGGYGSSGSSGDNTTGCSAQGTGGAGGAAGKAIDLSGGSINWVSGDNATHLKGAVS